MDYLFDSLTATATFFKGIELFLDSSKWIKIKTKNVPTEIWICCLVYVSFFFNALNEAINVRRLNFSLIFNLFCLGINNWF